MPSRPPIHGQQKRQEQRRQQRKDFDKRRYSEHDRSFYGSQAWLRLRAWVLASEPLCRECLRLKAVRAATVVDHIIDRRKAPDRALDPTNLQPLCKSCHDRKTAREHWRRDDEQQSDE